MLPGKASRLPVPSRFRIRAVQNAIAIPYTGPKNTPAITLHRCCTGKHLDAPIGMENVERETANAVSIPLTTTFFVLIFILFFFLSCGFYSS